MKNSKITNEQVQALRDKIKQYQYGDGSLFWQMFGWQNNSLTDHRPAKRQAAREFFRALEVLLQS
jgi:hypothetical protein